MDRFATYLEIAWIFIALSMAFAFLAYRAM